MPASIEKEIAENAKHMREQHYPVFPEDVMKWAAKAIAGTDPDSYFPAGTPTRGWYRGWLKRIKFLTRSLRPLELTRKEWFTAENLATYFEISKGVLSNTGVAVVNLDYDPNVPYSEEILITKPERICFYDETKMQLDCTRGGKGRTYNNVRWIPEDDGTTVATKSDKCTSASSRRWPIDVAYAADDDVDAE